MKNTLLFVLTGLPAVHLTAQERPAPDTAVTLQTVTVKAYEQNRQLKEVSGAINYIGKPQLERFSNTSLLPALNTTPGVHMEERSPGSFRLNVRGSTLRSPFGVRNIKVYWNNIPFTDPGGNTYLNQLSYYNINSIEVIKGPAGSLYGAGTGGAVLLNSQPDQWTKGADAGYILGSYNLNSLYAQVRLGGEDNHNSFGYTHQTSDGYRDHTQTRRDVATWETQLRINERQSLQASVLYGDLYYQTPGGLTKTEYNNNPRGARPNADALKAGIYQQTFLAGLSHQYRITDKLDNNSVVYGAFSIIKNPTFRNYEKRTEPHFGGRTVFNWLHAFEATQLKLSWGAEAQRGFFNTKTFQNKQGNPDSVLTDDDINNWLYSVFAQASVQLPGNWNLDAGISFNKSSITITRLSVPSFVPVNRTYSNEWAPRVALSKKIIPQLLIYASVAKGFSPPTTQEVLPSTSVISTGLNPEQGINYEAGIKSSWLQQRLYVEVNVFDYRLKNAIVQRRDASNADYFVNAGSTKQFGIESQAYYQLLPGRHGFISGAKVWVSHTWSRFKYDEFKQGATDFSGKQLPSVAPHIVAAGLDLTTRPGIYANLTWYYSDPIALNDANTEKASAYQLSGGRLGWRTRLAKGLMADFFAGADNLFDVRYSLGNDINAAAGRYFNAAAGANYFGGIILKYNK
ncbi:TonB-dependent receptor [Paraflavitalea sp. CAU 1676]|uniref:TonB-dependent receptor n=1 Tax=Paraflavitalea sp. CAU 1676 TaxID=3032598 RepID=UPI0023DA5D48|nr:TonB-dependent receptor [Paraflavitalea sp. CAU 1676]MDF2187196.1 TonB-dependent receptor [Paraflavitalea sp. CAU 1676]